MNKNLFRSPALFGASAAVCVALAIALTGALGRIGGTAPSGTAPQGTAPQNSTAQTTAQGGVSQNTPAHSVPFAKLPKTKMSAPKGREVATFAAGCFWCFEAMFKQLKGVDSVEPGYAGGFVANPTYEQVGGGASGHAEAFNIIYNPKVITYHDLVGILMTVHDPTTLNRQGSDVGTEYRSAIYYHTPQQQQVARAVIKQVTAERLWNNPIVTEVTPFANFYRAENYHLDYYNRNPDQMYCKLVIAPKVKKFQEKYQAKLKR
jgi:peptide-methionine (S)-S-oxide reductase